MFNHTSTIKLLRMGLVLLALILIPGLVGAQSTSTHPFQTTYKFTFEGTWTKANNHPTVNLPPPAHFSPLVGAVHNSSVSFWQAGQNATPGLEDVAEIGVNTDFEAEINAAIGSNKALSLVTKSGTVDNTGTSTINSITVNKDFPLFTLATMIAPSHDWFVGVSGLSLIDGDGKWKEQVEVDLLPYDAGTEDGTDFSLSPSVTTNPIAPITNIAGVAPLTANPFARLTLERVNYSDTVISKSVETPTTITTGSIVTYTLTMINGGDQNAPGTSMTDTLPNDVAFDSWINQNGASHNSGIISWGGNVPGNGSPVMISYRAIYTGPINNQSVSSTAEFSHSSGNSGTATATFIAGQNAALTNFVFIPFVGK